MSVDEYLKVRTGEGAQFWMDRIGQLIHNNSDPGTRESDVKSWLGDLVSDLWAGMRHLPIYNWKTMDENIAISSVLGAILSLWSCRIIRAKSYDNRRPLEVRQNMMRRLLTFQRILFECTVDETHDHQYFPAQEWHSPFTEERKILHEQKTQTPSDPHEDS